MPSPKKPSKNIKNLGLDPTLSRFDAALVDVALLDETPLQRARMEEEKIRQKTLPKGWNAVKDLSWQKAKAPSRSRYVWRYYVAYFVAKGKDIEEGMLVVSSWERAVVLAGHMDDQCAIPAWL